MIVGGILRIFYAGSELINVGGVMANRLGAKGGLIGLARYACRSLKGPTRITWCRHSAAKVTPWVWGA